MIFPSEKKKELWRYASRNNPVTCDADGIPIPMEQPQPQHHPHQRHPQLMSICGGWPNDSSAMRQLNTPPPPYSMDSLGCNRLNHHNPTEDYHHHQHYHHPHHYQHQQQQHLIYRSTDAVADADTAVCGSTTEETDYSYIKSGCNYSSSGAEILSDENGPYQLTVPPACYTESIRYPPPTPIAATIAMTAANMFRNCCGGGHSTDSSTGSNTTMTTRSPTASRRQILSRQHRTSNPTCPMYPTNAGAVMAAPLRQRTLNQNFNALLKPFKSKQIAELLLAVKSRVDPAATKCNTLATNNVLSNATTTPSYLQCILIKCTAAGDEDQHVTTCQLFFWSDLRVADELRRLPTCPNARDIVYVCCNPLHWYRIIQPIDSESAPPPYQRTKMLRLRDADSEGNSQNIERSSATAWAAQSNSSSQHSKSISSIIKQAELYPPSLESFTTDGKDRSACSKVWCQIAYWELAQRVGEFFHAKKSAVNIYGDGPIDGAGESMCLRDLDAKKPSPPTVQNTRQKVGLGVTLSLEGGDVWIYNRSNVPIFVDSPTLAERLDRVCKVLPGYCLKAFETHRAQWLACNQTQHNQVGPIDRFSMKISFVKGWGNTYHRQDIMGCPCWLEVHFNHLR